MPQKRQMEVVMLEIINLKEINSIKDKIIEIRGDSDEFYKNTPHRLLDIFSHSLTVQEAEQVSFEYKDLHLKNEYKQIGFFKELFIDNGDAQLIVEMDYKEMDEQTHLNILDTLDRYEQYLWVNHMVKTDIDKVTDFFRVERFDDLKMLLQINAREVIFSSFHFLGLGVSIRGHFDMSMELFFKNTEQIPKLEELANKYGLYVRIYPEELNH